MIALSLRYEWGFQKDTNRLFRTEGVEESSGNASKRVSLDWSWGRSGQYSTANRILLAYSFRRKKGRSFLYTCPSLAFLYLPEGPQARASRSGRVLRRAIIDQASYRVRAYAKQRKRYPYNQSHFLGLYLRALLCSTTEHYKPTIYDGRINKLSGAVTEAGEREIPFQRR